MNLKQLISKEIRRSSYGPDLTVLNLKGRLRMKFPKSGKTSYVYLA